MGIVFLLIAEKATANFEVTNRRSNRREFGGPLKLDRKKIVSARGGLPK
jgi:hypothetical protein